MQARDQAEDRPRRKIGKCFADEGTRARASHRVAHPMIPAARLRPLRIQGTRVCCRLSEGASRGTECERPHQPQRDDARSMAITVGFAGWGLTPWRGRILELINRRKAKYVLAALTLQSALGKHS